MLQLLTALKAIWSTSACYGRQEAMPRLLVKSSNAVIGRCRALTEPNAIFDGGSDAVLAQLYMVRALQMQTLLS